jgi:hypothetical protein
VDGKKSFSSVAASAGNGWIDLPLLFKLRTDLQLLGERAGMPVHIKDLGGRAKAILWSTVTIKTPLHAQGLGLIDDTHLIDGTMAAVTAYTTVHMDGMIEVGVIRQAVNLHPGNRLTCLPALAHSGETGAIGKNLALAMTVDTGLRGREIRVGGNFHEAMTVTAVHSELLHMEGVGKGDRLIRLVANAGVLRREVIPDSKRDGCANNQHTDKELERQPIGPSGKKIRHRVIEIARPEVLRAWQG